MKANIKLMAVLFLLTGVLVNAQTEEQFQRKIDHFKPMKTIGIVLIVASVPIGALGTVFLVKSNDTSDDLEGIFDWMYDYTFGYALLEVGGTFLIAGTAMTIISTAIIKKYQSKLDKLRIGAYYTPYHSGFSLTFRF